MKTVKTIFGEISSRDLGFVDMHDHIWKNSEIEVARDIDFAIDNIKKSQEELLSFEKAGGKTLVNMQPLGTGRDIEKVRQIAQVTNVNIVAVTGFHNQSFYHKSHFVNHYSVDELEELIISEIKEGIEVNDFNGPLIHRSESKAGAIKCGTSYYNITNLEKKLIEIASKASIKTSAPIITHTDMGTMGVEQVKLIKSYGIEPEKICIGHLDRNLDSVIHEQILKEGVYVQYDCVARVKYHPIIDTINLILRMEQKGYGNRIVIGGDWGRSSYLSSYSGAPGLKYLPEEFQYLMKDYGVSDKLIHKIFYENPANFLSF